MNRAYAASSLVMSVVMIVLGAAMIAIALAGGGGPLATGVLLGALFVGAGSLRLYAAWKAGGDA